MPMNAICHYCQHAFFAHHQNMKYCSAQCNAQARKVYQRDYHRKLRGHKKRYYRLNQTGAKIFFVIPVRYVRHIQSSQATWYSSFQKNQAGYMVTLAPTGETPLAIYSSQYRVYVPQDVWPHVPTPHILKSWGVVFHPREGSILAFITRTPKEKEAV